MRVKIEDVPVRENIEICLELMRRTKQKSIKKAFPSEKIFSAWLNRVSGQLIFAEFKDESLYLADDEWKPVEISYLYDPQKGEICFLLEEREAAIKGFRWDDLAPVAQEIFRKTMVVLNEACRRLSGPSDLDTKVTVLIRMDIDSETMPSERNILFEAWHIVDRLGAESLLMERPVGSYLFRRDPFCEILEQQLQELHKKVIKCFTLSYSEPNKKFCDRTLVHCDGKWQCYDDDPSLQQPSFNELIELLD